MSISLMNERERERLNRRRHTHPETPSSSASVHQRSRLVDDIIIFGTFLNLFFFFYYQYSNCISSAHCFYFLLPADFLPWQQVVVVYSVLMSKLPLFKCPGVNVSLLSIRTSCTVFELHVSTLSNLVEGM